VSLHRGEGFGLTMAEAMSLSKPVIATRYGGNLEFMSEKNSYLCSFKRGAVGEGNEPYPATAEWAVPDIDHAASLMRYVYEHPAEAAARGSLARRDIESSHSVAACARFVTERLAQIEKMQPSHSSVVFHANKRPAGVVELRIQEALEDLQARVRDIASLEEELDAAARHMSALAAGPSHGGLADSVP